MRLNITRDEAQRLNITNEEAQRLIITHDEAEHHTWWGSEAQQHTWWGWTSHMMMRLNVTHDEAHRLNYTHSDEAQFYQQIDPAIVRAFLLVLWTSLLYRKRYIVVSFSSDKWTYCKSLWIKAFAKCPKCKCNINSGCYACSVPTVKIVQSLVSSFLQLSCFSLPLNVHFSYLCYPEMTSTQSKTNLMDTWIL